MLPRTLARALVLVMLAAVFWIGGRAAQDQLSPMRVGVDDANIYFRYGRNLAQGLGCVWNPGGERVEGCTSPLWTAACAAGFVASGTPERGLFILSVVLAAVAAWIVALGCARAQDPRPGAGATLAAGAAVAAWVGTSPGFVTWMTATLMDTAIWTFALVVAWRAAVAWLEDPASRARRIVFGLALLVLANGRPEGPGASLALLAGAAVLGRDGLRAGLRQIATPAAILFAGTAACFVARRLYFGYWLPNTYYAKIDADLGFRIGKGAEYLAWFARSYPAAVIAAVVASVLSLVRGRRAAGAILASALIAFGIVNALFVAGDFFGGWRILQPYWLLVPLPVFAAISGRTRRIGWPSAVLIALAAASLLGPVRWQRLAETTLLGPSFFLAEYGRMAGVGFNQIFPPDERPTVGVVAGGGFPFVYEGRSFDLLGLNDVEMAHASRARRGAMHGHGGFHGPTFFKRPPELLIGLTQVVPIDRLQPAQDRIPFGQLDAQETQRFDELYVSAAMANDASRAVGIALPVWARRDWLARVAGRFPIREIGMAATPQAPASQPEMVPDSRRGLEDESRISFPGSGTSTGWLPIELHRGTDIYLKGKVNGVETDLFLDSGASTTTLATPFADTLGLETKGTSRVRGVGGKQAVEVRGGIRIEIGSLTLRIGRTHSMDLAGMTAWRGRATRVILGRELFEELVVDLDFPRSRVGFHASPSYVYTGQGRTVPLFLGDSIPRLIEVQIEDLAPAKFLLDTGSANSIELSPHFWKDRGLLDGRTIQSAQGVGVGAKFPIALATLRSITFAGHQLRNVPAGFVENEKDTTFESPESGGNLGMDILSRFRLIVDYSRLRAHVEAEAGYDSRPFKKDRVGLGARFDAGSLRVEVVKPNSPAEKAGWKTGQRIKAVNGQLITAANWWEIVGGWRLLSPGAELRLADDFGNERTLVAADYY